MKSLSPWHGLEPERPTGKIDLVRLGPEAAEETFTLHRRVLQSLATKEFMYPRDRAFFRKLAAEGGLVGARLGGELIGYAALRRPREPHCTHWRSLTALGVDRTKLSQGAGAGVHPAHRKRGIFTALLKMRDEAALSFGAPFLTSVVSPANFASLVPLLRAGYMMAAIHADRDGENYLLVKSLLTGPPVGSKEGTRVFPADVSGNLAQLRTGELCGLPSRHQLALTVSYCRTSSLALPWTGLAQTTQTNGVS